MIPHAAFSNREKVIPIKKPVTAIYYDFRMPNFCHMTYVLLGKEKCYCDFMMQLRKVFCQLNYFIIQCFVVLYFFSLGRNQKAIPE
jgi:hypothetical protein